MAGRCRLRRAVPLYVLRDRATRSKPLRRRGRSGFHADLGNVAANKPANREVYTTYFAEFVDTFTRVLGDPQLPLLFFIEGGALAVENALKCTFDWKSRHNEAAGHSQELGTKVLHLTKAFHGRSGYTLSLTNIDPVKPRAFPSSTGCSLRKPSGRSPG